MLVHNCTVAAEPARKECQCTLAAPSSDNIVPSLNLTTFFQIYKQSIRMPPLAELEPQKPPEDNVTFTQFFTKLLIKVTICNYYLVFTDDYRSPRLI